MKQSISVREAQEFDRFAQEKLGIPSIILMENAGRGVAEEAMGMGRALGGSDVRFVGRSAGRAHRGRLTLCAAVVCGTGNNDGNSLQNMV